MDRDRLVDEILILLPDLWRELGRPRPEELEGVPEGRRLSGVHVSTGHIQILVALSRGPRSVGQLAEAIGVSTPAVSQLVGRLVEHGIVERRHAESDRRVVLVDYAPGTREVARRIFESRRGPLERALGQMSSEEAEAFVKGLRLTVESFENVREARS